MSIDDDRGETDAYMGRRDWELFTRFVESIETIVPSNPPVQPITINNAYIIRVTAEIGWGTRGERSFVSAYFQCQDFPSERNDQRIAA